MDNKKSQVQIVLDLKSLIIGLLLGVSLLAVLGADGDAGDNQYRYQITSGGLSEVFLLDRKTGDLWNVYVENYSNTVKKLRADEKFTFQKFEVRE